MSTPASVDWIVPSIADLRNVMADAAFNAYRTKALASGQADPFNDVMETITNEIRGKINRHMIISETDNSVPPSLLRLTCLMIIKAMESRLPSIQLTKTQDEERQDGLRRLDQINRNEVPVEYPSDPMPNTPFQVASIADLVSAADSTYRTATRTTMAGL